MRSRADWDAKYRVPPAPIPEPDEFLHRARPYLPGRTGVRAADVACGGGRHAVQLALWGLSTTAIDYSRQALRLCRERASLAGVALDTACLDLEAPGIDLGSERYDLVAVFNYLHRPLVPRLKSTVRGGGIIVYKTYTRKQMQFRNGPRNPKFMLGDGELLEMFGDFRHLLYVEECETEATAALVAQRPC